MSRTLIVAPTAREAAAFGPGAIVCGAGSDAGDAVASRLHANAGAYDLVVIAGVCGGLDPSLQPGSLILARRSISAASGEELAVDVPVFDALRRTLRTQHIPFVSSVLLTVERPVASVVEKTDLWNRYGAGGVDMETHVVATASIAAGVPWIAIRAVLDPAGVSLPASLRDWDANSDDRDIARAALRRPAEWLAYARLALGLRQSLAALRSVAPAIEGFAPPIAIDLAILPARVPA